MTLAIRDTKIGPYHHIVLLFTVSGFICYQIVFGYCLGIISQWFVQPPQRFVNELFNEAKADHIAKVTYDESHHLNEMSEI